MSFSTRDLVLTPRVYTDERGSVFELLRLSDVLDDAAGQIFVTTAEPGQSKGHHYHDRKTEWFCVLHGQAAMVLENIESGERTEIEMNAEKPLIVRVEPRIAHALDNRSDEPIIAIVFVDEVYDPEDPDTHEFRVF